MTSNMAQPNHRRKPKLPVTHDLSPAAVWLIRHRRVPRDLAQLVAELAGLGGTEVCNG